MAVSASACSGLIQNPTTVRHVPPLLPKIITTCIMIVSSAFPGHIQKRNKTDE